MVTENFIQKSSRIRLMRVKYRNPKRAKEEMKAGKMTFICCFLRQTLAIKNAFPNSLFDQQGFAEAKAHKKPGKIYCFSMFRGHRDSIIKRLVK